jgi:CIC family chloride channel protein
MPLEPAPFVIIGMMSLFGGIAHAPLAVMLMVAEMTGNLSLLAPAMVAVAISTALVGDHTIYRSQLRTRADSPAHRVRLSFPLLSSLVVRDAVIPDQPPMISIDTSAASAQTYFSNSNVSDLAVINDRQEIIGFINHADIEKIPLHEREKIKVHSLIKNKELLFLSPDQSLDVALDRITSRGLSWAPVMDDHHVIGRLNVRDIVQTYKMTLAKSVRRAGSLTPDTIMFEVTVDKSSPLAGRRLREAGLPPETMIVSVTHNSHTIFPNADTILDIGDKAFIMASKNSEKELRTFLRISESNRKND